MTEVFLPFSRLPVEPVTEVRSTLLLAGIQSVRAQGLYPQYSDVLSPGVRERIVGLAGGIWVPVELAVAHYSALERLAIGRLTIEALGAEVAERTWKHILAPVFARAKRIGPKPWEAFSHTHETVKLNWRGGDVQITKEGETQALYEWVRQPCANVPYFVTSFGSFMRALTNLFSFASALQRRARTIVSDHDCPPPVVGRGTATGSRVNAPSRGRIPIELRPCCRAKSKPSVSLLSPTDGRRGAWSQRPSPPARLAVLSSR